MDGSKSNERNGVLLLVSLTLAAGSLARTPVPSAADAVPTGGSACVRCHDAMGPLDHPVGLAVSSAPDLPLGPGNRIECITCHVVDGRHAAAPRTDRPRVRRPGRTLCLECHALPRDEDSAMFHAIVLGAAHPPRDSRGRSDSRPLDAETRACLSCHDGSAASSVLARDGGLSGHQHALGEDYRTARRRRRGLHLKAASDLPAGIRLRRGRVGCGTCHSAYAARGKMLILGTGEGRLCTACHGM